jgi:hypothetical protein
LYYCNYNIIFYTLDLNGTGEDGEKSDSEESTSTDYVSSFSDKKRKGSDLTCPDAKKSLLIGSGSSEETLINKIVDLVTQKFKASEEKIGKGIDLSPPTAEYVSISPSAPLPFNNTILKNDDNDKFGNLILKITNNNPIKN